MTTMNAMDETQRVRGKICPNGQRARSALDPVPASELRPDLERDCLAAMVSGMHRDCHLLGDCLDICGAQAFVTPQAHPLAQALDLLRRSGEKPGLEPLARQMQTRWAADPKTWPRPDPADLADLCRSTWGNRESALFFARALADEHRRENLRADLLDLAIDAAAWGADPDELAHRARALGEAAIGLETPANLSNVMSRVLKRMDSPNPQDVLPLPWPGLNRVLRGGLMRQELVVLAGRPGTGKTALAGCLAVETARSGRGVLFISREMGDESLGARMLAREAKVDNRFYREGAAGPKERERLQYGATTLAALPLAVVEKSTGPLCPREARRLSRGVKNLGLVVIDYLQLMQPDESGRNREQDIAAMSRAFKTLAMDFCVPVLLLSQLNRGMEQADREPRVSDLRESGAIEQDADIVLLLHVRRKDTASPAPTIKAIVGKSRGTGTGAAYLKFEKAFSDFRETEPWAQDAEQQEENGL